MQSESTIEQQLSTSRFCKCDDLVLQELGTEQEFPILFASVAGQVYEFKKQKIRVYVSAIFQGKQCPVDYLKGGRYLHRA